MKIYKNIFDEILENFTETISFPKEISENLEIYKLTNEIFTGKWFKEDHRFIYVLPTLSGVPKDKISVEIDDQNIIVKWDFNNTFFNKKGEQKIKYFGFLDKNTLKVDYKDGVLYFEMKYKEENKPQKIEIQ